MAEKSWTFKLTNNAAEVPQFVHSVVATCAHQMPEKAAVELSLALREMIHNAIEHGNLGISFDEKSWAVETGTLDEILDEQAMDPEREGRRVTVDVMAQERQITVSVTDEGDGFDWKNLLDPRDPEHQLAPTGRGILLARSSVDSLDYNDKGNSVTFVKRY